MYVVKPAIFSANGQFSRVQNAFTPWFLRLVSVTDQTSKAIFLHLNTMWSTYGF